MTESPKPTPVEGAGGDSTSGRGSRSALPASPPGGPPRARPPELITRVTSGSSDSRLRHIRTSTFKDHPDDRSFHDRDRDRDLLPTPGSHGPRSDSRSSPRGSSSLFVSLSRLPLVEKSDVEFSRFATSVAAQREIDVNRLEWRRLKLLAPPSPDEFLSSSLPDAHQLSPTSRAHVMRRGSTTQVMSTVDIWKQVRSRSHAHTHDSRAPAYVDLAHPHPHDYPTKHASLRPISDDDAHHAHGDQGEGASRSRAAEDSSSRGGKRMTGAASPQSPGRYLTPETLDRNPIGATPWRIWARHVWSCLPGVGGRRREGEGDGEGKGEGIVSTVGDRYMADGTGKSPTPPTWAVGDVHHGHGHGREGGGDHPPSTSSDNFEAYPWWGRSVVFGLPIIPPIDRLWVLWTLYMWIVDAVYIAFLFPASVAMDLSVNRGIWAWLDLVVSVTFLAHMTLSMSISFIAVYDLHGRLIMDGRETARLYLSNPIRVFIDAISFLPFFTQCLALGLPNDRTVVAVAKYTRYSRVIRLCAFGAKLYRAANTADVTQKTYVPKGMSRGLRFFLLLTYTYLVLINALGCFLLAAAEWQNPDLEGTWVDANGFLYHSEFDRYVASVYWALTTVSTVGYGDITPSTNFERFLMLFVESIGVLFFASVTGSITSHIQRLNQVILTLHTFTPSHLHTFTPGHLTFTFTFTFTSSRRMRSSSSNDSTRWTPGCDRPGSIPRRPDGSSPSSAP